MIISPDNLERFLLHCGTSERRQCVNVSMVGKLLLLLYIQNIRFHFDLRNKNM